MDKTETVTLTLTEEQAAALQPLLVDPNRLPMLINFIDNMLAAKRVSKIIAWVFGVSLALLTAYFYFSAVFGGKGPHGVP